MSKYSVLVSDALGAAGLKILEAHPDIDTIVETGLDPDALKAKLNEVDAVIIRSGTTITAEALEGNSALKAIGRAGIGVDNVDLPAATERGIVVMNTPGGNAITTAEHTISLMMSAARRIPQAYAKLRDGDWDRKSFVGTELSGKTLGIIGLGNIGALVVERARGLKMDVVGYDPFVSEERAAQLGVELAAIEDVIARADVLTLHVPLTDKTKNLIAAEQFKAMKSDAILVNCARGGIVDEVALNAALDNGDIAAAALDVFAEEPPAADHPLLHNPHMVFTPHLGASTKEAQTKVAVDVAQQIVDFLTKGEIKNSVNAPSVSGDLLTTLGPYLELGGKMGALAAQLHDGPVEKICVKFSGDITQHQTAPIVGRCLAAVLQQNLEEPVNEINASRVAETRGIGVESTSTSHAEDYASMIQLLIEGHGKATSVTGAVFGKNDPRIVRINDFRMEPLAPHGTLLFAINRDEPGVIGRVGTIMGEAGINIAQMNVGRAGADDEGLALTVIAVDATVDAPVVERIAELPPIVEVRQLVL